MFTSCCLGALQAVLASCLVLCAGVWGFYPLKAAADTISSLDSSFCHGGLEVKYPELDLDKCLIIPKERKLREKVSTVWKAPQIHFSAAHELAELGSIAKAALREQRLDISLILIPSRVHSKNKMYVLVMVDPDAPSRAKPTSAYWRHWLVADIQGSALKKGQIQGTTLTDYRPPTPPPKSGLHRYQFMLFEQPPKARVSLTEQELSARGKWDLQAFVRRFGLGAPVASLQFLTENYND